MGPPRTPACHNDKRPEAEAPDRSQLAEGVGFEPTEAQKTSTVFETVPFVRSGSLPCSRLATIASSRARYDSLTNHLKACVMSAEDTDV